MRFLPSTICQKLKSYASNRRPVVAAVMLTIWLLPGPARAADDLTFDLAEIDTSRPYSWNGLATLRLERADLRQDGSAALLRGERDPENSSTLLAGGLQLGGSYSQGLVKLVALGEIFADSSDLGWQDQALLYEGYLQLRPQAEWTASAGKKSYKWGKGYAWNPVGFLGRSKDPNNPEEALEGYLTGEVEWIKSLSGDLQNLALTVVVLPVWQDVNDDFGSEKAVNAAAKLYLLYHDTDIDLIVAAGDSRSTRIGFDFARNISSNFEIHGEFACLTDQRRMALDGQGNSTVSEADTVSLLAGLRYLSESELTTIVEYYYQENGFDEESLTNYHQLVTAGWQSWLDSSDGLALTAAGRLAAQGYGRAFAGQHYLYSRFSQKEPANLLYWNAALTTIVNLADGSFSIAPEISYTGITDWEILLRFFLLEGPADSEYGEKLNENKIELRLRYYF